MRYPADMAILDCFGRLNKYLTKQERYVVLHGFVSSLCLMDGRTAIMLASMIRRTDNRWRQPHKGELLLVQIQLMEQIVDALANGDTSNISLINDMCKPLKCWFKPSALSYVEIEKEMLGEHRTNGKTRYGIEPANHLC